MLLIGHGGIGAIMARDWTPYLAVLGVGTATVETRILMPVVGWVERRFSLLGHGQTERHPTGLRGRLESRYGVAATDDG